MNYYGTKDFSCFDMVLRTETENGRNDFILDFCKTINKLTKVSKKIYLQIDMVFFKDRPSRQLIKDGYLVLTIDDSIVEIDKNKKCWRISPNSLKILLQKFP